MWCRNSLQATKWSACHTDTVQQMHFRHNTPTSLPCTTVPLEPQNNIKIRIPCSNKKADVAPPEPREPRESQGPLIIIRGGGLPDGTGRAHSSMSRSRAGEDTNLPCLGASQCPVRAPRRMRAAQENNGDLTCDCGSGQRLQPELARPHPGMVEKTFPWGGGGGGGGARKPVSGGRKRGSFGRPKKTGFFSV